MGSTSRLRFTGPGDEGVTVKICIDRGVIIVYGSYTVPNPNAALHDFSATLNATGGEVMASSCLVSHVNSSDIARSMRDCSYCRPNTLGRRRRQADEEVTIYITIEGVSDTESQFTVNSSFGDAFGKETLPLLMVLLQ